MVGWEKSDEVTRFMIFRSASTKSLVLLDFLAPNLTTRAFGSSISHKSSKWNRKTPSQPVLPPALSKTLQESVHQKIRAQNVVTSDQQADVYNTLLVQTKHALGKKDAKTLRQLWIELKRLDLAHIIPLKLVSDMSTLFIKTFLSIPSSNLDLSIRETAEELALAAASYDAEGVAAWMLYHVKRNDPEAALSLYGRCSHIMTEKDPENDQPSQEGLSAQDELAIGNAEMLHSTSPLIHGRVYLLLAATTAHAMRDAFQDALEMCKNTSVRFHHYTTREFLESLQDDSTLHKKVDLYVRRLHLAKLVSRPPSLSKQIMNLGDTRALVLLKKLYDDIVEGILGPNPFIASDESSMSSDKTVAMTVVGWTSFLSAFLNCSAKDVAAQVWEDIARFGLPHETAMWNALIAGQAQSFSDATVTFEHMRSRKIKPDALTYRALISSLFNGRRPNLAMDRFQAFQSIDWKDISPPEDVMSVYNTTLNGLLITNRIEAASSLFGQMEVSGPKPDIVSYNTFLGHYARANDLRGLGTMMNKMSESGMNGDVFSFSTILSALLRMGRGDAAEVVFRLMAKQGVKPNTATYTALIDHQMRERDEAHLNGALELLSRMEADSTISPNVVTYTAILAGIHRGTPWLSKQKEEDFTRNILERMKRNDVKLNTRAYNILIKSCLEGSRLDQVLSYYAEMKRTRTPMFHETWYILLEGLVGLKEWSVAREVVKDMGLYEVRPMGRLQKLVQQTYSRGSTKMRIR